MPTRFKTFFADLAEAFNRSLAGEVEHDAIRRGFANCFIAAGPRGSACGLNNDAFSAVLDKVFAHHRANGLRRIAVRRVHATPIDAAHHQVRVFYTVERDATEDEPAVVERDVAYLIEEHGKGPCIFAFVSDDELTVYRDDLD